MMRNFLTIFLTTSILSQSDVYAHANTGMHEDQRAFSEWGGNQLPLGLNKIIEACFTERHT